MRKIMERATKPSQRKEIFPIASRQSPNNSAPIHEPVLQEGFAPQVSGGPSPNQRLSWGHSERDVVNFQNFSPKKQRDEHKSSSLTPIKIQKRKNEFKPPTNEGG
jgi:hypothetical protein